MSPAVFTNIYESLCSQYHAVDCMVLTQYACSVDQHFKNCILLLLRVILRDHLNANIQEWKRCWYVIIVWSHTSQRYSLWNQKFHVSSFLQDRHPHFTDTQSNTRQVWSHQINTYPGVVWCCECWLPRACSNTEYSTLTKGTIYRSGE